MFSVQTICNLYILLSRRIVVVGKKKLLEVIGNQINLLHLKKLEQILWKNRQVRV